MRWYVRLTTVAPWLILLVLTGLVACQPSSDKSSKVSEEGATPSNQSASKEQPPEEDTLVFVTRNSPTTYYYDAQEQLAGFEYELAVSFAELQGKKVEFIVVDTLSEALQAAKDNQGHFVSSGITRTAAREKSFTFGPSYQDISQQLVCHRKGPKPDKIENLHQVSLTVADETSYEERLSQLKQTQPELSWSVSNELSTEQILEQVADKQVNCTIADSNIVAINRRYHPELVVVFDVTQSQPLAWILTKRGKHYQKALANWHKKHRKDSIKRLYDKYYGYIPIYDYVDVRALHRAIDDRLPRYIDWFQYEANKHSLSWSLLAAQGYQESHWKPRAKSPTGVRGLMMLTRTTAKAMGVENRLDPRESIRGGAKYLAKMIKRVPDNVIEEDRVWFALAAYNVGMGHMHDAQTLARKLGKEPGRWDSLSEVLPLLAQKKYYKDLRYGYARGSEPVRYIQRIRNYQNIIEQTLKPN
jgi:membrane-bound lytic murein transglycosylase F